MASKSVTTRETRHAWLLAAASLLAVSLASGSAFAQQVQSQGQGEQATGEEEELEQIVVTGSRIRRDAFTSTSPLQVIEPDESIKLGVSNLTDLLQRSTLVTGTQIDNTINTNAGNANATEAPPTGGIGSSNVDLRALGPERTLILMNGKRLGVAGVRGAPAQPDINLIPLAMLDRIEILTGGYSTIYGADAVAGVVNLITKKDFEGVDVSGSIELPEHGGAEAFRNSIVFGVNGEQGNITIGFEYYKQERLSTGQRKYTRCFRDIEVSEDGKTRIEVCRSPFFDNIVVIGSDFVPGAEPGTVIPGVTGPDGLSFSDALFFYYTPGQTDIGVPNWSTAFALPQPSDPHVRNFPNDDINRALNRFVYNDFYNDQDERRAADMVRPTERISVVANGYWDLDWGHNEQLYFETFFFDRKNKVRASTEQIFPDVPGMIPQEDENGNIIVDDEGNPILVDNPLNPFPVTVAPIVTLDDIPQNFNVDVQQFRGVIGFRGDIGGGWFEEHNWNYDAYFTYDRGSGFQSQTILFEPNLTLALQTLRLDADGNVICGLKIENPNGFLTPQECVPVNLFAPSIYEDGEGRFATDAERDFLLGTRTNRTVTQQFDAAMFMNGELFTLPTADEPVATAFGFEWRRDTINSQNDIVGVKALNAAENPSQEGDTIGSRWIYDLYAEVSVPVVTRRKFVELFQVDGAVRYTEEQNFGNEVTWRLSGTYRPVDYVTFYGSFNTSFRAPNLREQFLADQAGGVSGTIDPCLARNVEVLDPNDERTQILLANCALSGADVTVLGTGGVTTIPVIVGGTTDLKAETSDSYVAQMQFRQPWFDSFDFDIAFTYFSIKVKNTVEELDPATIVNRCFFDEPNLASPFCDRVERPGVGPGGDPRSNIISLIDASFINIGRETSKGLDVVTRFRATVGEFDDAPVDIIWTTGTTRMLDQVRQVFPDSPKIDNVGRIGNPKWLVSSTVNVQWKRYQFLWQLRYIGQTEFPEDQLDPEEPFRVNPEFNTTVPTRDDAVADRRLYNDVSLTANFDRFALTFGVRNLTDTKPPLIEAFSGPNRNNAVTSSGFDLIGRTWFLRGTVRF